MTKINQDNDVTNHTSPFYVEKKLNCHDRFNKVQSTRKSRQENDVTDCIGVIFVEFETELS